MAGACSPRPDGYAAFSGPEGVPLEARARFDGTYIGGGEPRVCETSEGPVTYDAPVVAGIVRGDYFVGNLDGCRVEMNVYEDGTVRGWTYIRTHRFIPLTYSLFDGKVEDGSIVGQFEQVLQGSGRYCDRGPVVLNRQDIEAELVRAGATVEQAIDYFAPPTRCRTGGIQFP